MYKKGSQPTARVRPKQIDVDYNDRRYTFCYQKFSRRNIYRLADSTKWLEIFLTGRRYDLTHDKVYELAQAARLLAIVGGIYEAFPDLHINVTNCLITLTRGVSNDNPSLRECALCWTCTTDDRVILYPSTLAHDKIGDALNSDDFGEVLAVVHGYILRKLYVSEVKQDEQP